jgi:transposase
MANRLKMAIIHAIRGLLEQGWSYRRIARALGVHRETVARYDKLRREGESKPAISTPGSGEARAGETLAACRSSGRDSFCEPYRDLIKAKLDADLSAQRIFQDLRTDTGFAGSYSSVKRFVRRLGAATPVPFRRMECAPGHEAQVDLGAGPWIMEQGRRRRPPVLRIMLSHSRKGYSEAIPRQTAEHFIRCLENSFRAFGGVPKTLVLDNLKAAVKDPDWFDPELNPKILSFARHYGVVILPTRPYSPHHKGKIESGIKYVKNNALKARVFGGFPQTNCFLAHWERTVADTRIHGTTKRQVHKVFEEIERPALGPLPAERFPFYHEARRKVHRDGYVEVAKAYYSVPPEYVGCDVWVRYDHRLVRVYNDRFEQVTVHSRVQPGRFNTQRRHIPAIKISVVERGTDYLISRAERIGADTGLWARAMIDERGLEGMRVMQGLFSLASKHPASVINRATRAALTGRCFRLRPLRKLCKRIASEEVPEFTDTHPIIRPLSQYQELVATVPQRERR